MSKLNDLATELFKKLINNGDKYLVKCSPYSIVYNVDGIKYSISADKDKFTETEFMKFRIYDNLFPVISNNYFGIKTNENVDTNNSTVFRICINDSRSYCVNITSRVDIALYLDKIDNIIKNWEKKQLKNAIVILNTEEFKTIPDSIDIIHE